MALYDPNASARLRCPYQGPYGTHTMLLRGALTGIESDLVNSLLALLPEFANWQYDGTVWTNPEFAAPGSHFYTPVDGWTDYTVDNAIGTSATDAPSAFLNMCGRSPSTGRRTKLYLFEQPLTGRNNMRILSGDNANVASLIDTLNGIDVQLDAIDGTPVTWKGYVNVGQNDYLTHKARRG